MELKINNLTKKYGEKYALIDFNAVWKPGIYGLLGPNGAGKSTLINLLTDNLARTGGSILLDGTDILKMGKEYRRLLGYMPQQQGFYEQFSAIAFLRYMGKLKGCRGAGLERQLEGLLDKVNLSEHKYEAMGSFSGGMRQRVLLAQALIGNPSIVILDEPTAGLDPKERINIRNLIAGLSQDKIILIATHVVSDIECIAGQVMLMKEGRLLKADPPSDLIDSVAGQVGEIPCTGAELPRLQEKYHSGNTIQRRNGLYFRIAGEELPKHAQPVPRDALTLEDVYLYYLGNEGHS